MFGFFKVIENKNISVELWLPQSMKIYNVFHFYLLQKILIDILSNQIKEPLPPFIINNKEKWEIKDILDAKSYQDKL